MVTIDTPAGPYGYHYRLEDWEYFNCPVLERAKHWDGYTEENVDRLLTLVDFKNWQSMLFDRQTRARIFKDILEKEKENE